MLLHKWSAHLAQAELIFVACVKHQQVCVVQTTTIGVLPMIIPKMNRVYAVAVVLLFGLGMVRLQK